MSKRMRPERAGLSCDADTPAAATLEPAPPAPCRYKTGRCTNPRVVKPNGALLLLCEFHRCQQNRTKKRSDMKYRQHRAAKRQRERASQRRCVKSASDKSAPALPSGSNSTVHQGSATQSSDAGLPSANFPRNDIPSAVGSAASPPPAVICSSATFKSENRSSASPTTSAEFESAISPWPSPLWADVLVEPPSLAALPSPRLPPPVPAWQPEELELLQFFIMS